MPVIPVGAQIFDVAFHPTFSVAYTALLNGYVKAFAYDEQGNHKPVFSVRPVKKSCRGLSLDQDGSHLYAAGKGKALSSIDTTTEAVDIRLNAHDATINRVKCLMSWLLATGDDDGVVKLWDPRQRDSVRSYSQHFDYITDFLWLDDKKQVVATSGDGTLSVMDVRAKKSVPVAQSDDQEDELLSIVAIKGGAKIIVGTQLGMLSVFNRNSGWGDCVDRIPGHPVSVDALCSLPENLPYADTQSTILTGSSDGLVRAVQILPTKLHGVVADHGDWPIERIAIGGGQGQLTLDQPEEEGSKVISSGGPKLDEDLPDAHRWWVGSVGHDEVLRMTDLEGFFRDKSGEGRSLGVVVQDEGVDDHEEPEPVLDDNDVEEVSTERSQTRKRKHQKEKEKVSSASAPKKKAKKNAIAVEGSFFDAL